MFSDPKNHEQWARGEKHTIISTVQHELNWIQWTFVAQTRYRYAIAMLKSLSTEPPQQIHTNSPDWHGYT